ncbi:MAG: AAA family ATPase [Candidatus Aenigmarchaeota archaeon]|nr:AAA family ATPase [Candidatus Aenigmarchaeota archaeon]
MTKVIGIIGLIGSGKHTIAEYISRKYGYRIFSMGTEGVSGRLTRKDGLELTRQNIQNTTERYRKQHGMDYLAKLVLREVLDSGCKKALITDMRKPEDIAVPRKYFGNSFLLIFIDAYPKIRFERLKKRNRKRDPKVWKEFLDQEKREHELFFSKSLGMHDFVIDNNSEMEKARKAVDKRLKEKGFIANP